MIKFLDLHKINAPYEAQLQEKLKNVLDKGWYILGKEVEQFEKAYAEYCGTPFCIGVGNGLDALTLIFKGYIALGKLQKGDEVIVPANTYIASILAILQADLVPVLVEPDEATYNLNPELIAEKITPKTKAILAVHLYGQLAAMQQINAVAQAHNLWVVEDAAQSHGAKFNADDQNLQPTTYNLQHSNNAVAYSFYPSKNLGALGDAGAITTHDAALAKILYSLRNYGSEIKYHNDFIGVNSRLDELQAAFLNVKLPHLNKENQRRIAIAKKYIATIKNKKIALPFFDNSSNHVFHLFVIRTKDRNELQKYLERNGIQTQIHYPVPPHKQKALPQFHNLCFPITERIHDEILSLPISPVMTDEEVEFVVKTINEWTS